MRRFLIGVIVLVVLAVLFNYLQSHYARMRSGKETPEILLPDTVMSAEGVEYESYNDGVLGFRIRIQHSDENRLGKNSLQGIEVYEVDPKGNVLNEIRSQNGEYDKKNKLANFSEDVRIYLGKEIEMRTNSLRYDLNKKIGSTEDFLEFYSKEARGSARGVRFDQKRTLLDLHNEVALVLTQTKTQPGTVFGTEELHATSDSARCSEAMSRITFRGNVRIKSVSEVLSSDEAEVVLEPDRKRILSLTATGNAAYESRDGSEIRVLKGDRLHFVISKSGKAVEKIDVSGKAQYSMVSPAAEFDLRGGEINLDLDAAMGLPMQVQSKPGAQFRIKREAKETFISGDQLQARFYPGTGVPEILYMHGQAALTEQSRAADSSQELRADEIEMDFRRTQGSIALEKLQARKMVRWVSKPLQKPGAILRARTRTLSATFLELLYSKREDFFESGSARGGVILAEVTEDNDPAREARQLLAESVRFSFFPGHNQLKDMDAEGNVRTLYAKPSSNGRSEAEKFQTASEKMRATFVLGDGVSTIATVGQAGKFSYEDTDRSATAEKADYDARKETLILAGSPAIFDVMGSTRGERIEYALKSKKLSVNKRVRSIIVAKGEGGSFFGSNTSNSPAIITADSMQYWMEAGRVRYEGNIQLLSENGQLQAEILQIFNGGERIEAQGKIRHLITIQEPTNAIRANVMRGGADKMNEDEISSPAPMTVRSSTLMYSKEGNAIAYEGDVTLRSEDFELRSKSLDAVLDSEARKIEYAIARGKVRIYQGKRECKGDEAEFYLDPGRFVVIGDPAEVYDPGRGRSFARRLTSFTTDDSIRLENR